MGKGLVQVTCLLIAVYVVCCVASDPCAGKTDDTRLPYETPTTTTCTPLITRTTPVPTTDCLKFYECQGGESIKKDCPPNHRYHHETQSCVLGKDCSGGVQSVCTSTKHVLAGDCKSYFPCTENPPGTYVNGDKVTCGESSEPAYLNPYDTDTAGPKCTAQQLWLCENGALAPNCALQEQNIFIGNPNSCEGYYTCMNKMRYSGSCKTGLRFDHKTGSCVHKKDGDCNESIGTTTIVPTKDICKDTKDNFVADPNSCQTYFYCQSQTLPPYQDFCPTETNPYFKDGKCVKTPPANCGCETVMDSIKKDGDVIQVKALRPDQYWVCKFGGAELKTCMTGTVYNETLSSCVKK